jgi:hypothetical protein
MTEWNYDTCLYCKHFALRRPKSVTRWCCKLNSGSAKEKNDFHLIWAYNYIINRGVMDESYRYEVEIEYVGKKKRRKP